MCCCCTKNDTELTPSVGVAMLEQNQTIKKSRTSRRDIKQQWQRNPAFDFKPSAPVRNMREQVWDLLRQGKGVTTTEICEQVNEANRKQIEYWLKGWIAGGYIKVIGLKRPYQNLIIRDIGQEPPRVDSLGKPIAMPLNESVWRAMRIQKTFNARQLVASTSAVLHINTVRTYLRQLAMAGYLKEVCVEQGLLTTYQLMENTGCKPPQILRGKKVFDPNLGIIVYDPKPQNQKETDHD